MLLIANTAFSGYITQHQIGWFWYHDRLEHKPKSKTNVKAQTPSPQSIPELRKTLQQSLETAISNPTEENIVHYIQIQNKLADMATLFSSAWQRALMQHPELNFGVEHPTSILGRQAYTDKLNQEKINAVKSLADQNQYGLFYFFNSTCPYCQKFSPIIKSFAEKFNISLIPISLDGRGTPSFPHPKINQGQAEKLNVTVVPTVIAVIPEKEQAIPISVGVVSESTLIDRIYQALVIDSSVNVIKNNHGQD